jgi:hypothetical protein
MDHGRIELVNLGEESIGRQVLEPGWRWSDHVKPVVGTPTCEFHHFGLVLSGRLRVEMADGTAMEVGPDAVYEIPPGHDAWVVGDEPWIGVNWSGIRTWGAPLLATGERILTTVLFTDIVGSTDVAARLGDGRWRTLLATHNDRVRRALDLEIRAAVHTGEVEVVGDDIRGVAVHLASRILALAGPGDILTSSTTRDLVDGSGLAFEDRGRHELKGISGSREVLALADG